MTRLVNKSLTDVAVRKAQPREQHYDLYDAVLRGFGLRVAVSGTKSWFVMHRVNGWMIRHTIGRYPEWSLAEARYKASDALKRMGSGETPRAPRSPGGKPAIVDMSVVNREIAAICVYPGIIQEELNESN